MMTRMVVMASVMALLLGCSETVYVQQEDAGSGLPDAGMADDAGEACGPDVYPCPPYGTVAPNVIANLTFTGWMDDNGDGDILNDPFRTWGLDYFYQLGLAGEAKFLFINVSAGWCYYCKQENKTLPAMAADLRPKGIVVAEILFEDEESGGATREFAERWVTTYQLPFPVGIDPLFKTGQYFDYAASPGNFIIALRDMTVYGEPVKAMQIMGIETGYDDAYFRSMLENLADNSE